MLRFTGLLSFPQGGWKSIALLCAVTGAITCTIWGATTCRFLKLTYQVSISNNDNNNDNDVVIWEDLGWQRAIAASQVQQETGDIPRRSTVALGLYSWLQPTEQTTTSTSSSTFDDNVLEWNVGSCVGYSQLFLQDTSDGMYEAARWFAVVATLLGLGMTIWMLGLIGCFTIAHSKWWKMALRLWLTICLVATAFMFFMLGWKICDNNDNDNNAIQVQKCVLDQGGLVVIAGVLFWYALLLWSIFFFTPIEETERALGLNRQNDDSNTNNANFWNQWKERRQQEKAVILPVDTTWDADLSWHGATSPQQERHITGRPTGSQGEMELELDTEKEEEFGGDGGVEL